MTIDNRYWAGLFDGEGSIYIAKNLRTAQVVVTQKELPILFMLQKQFGGKIIKYGKQTCHKWRVASAGDIEKFLEAIAPHAIIKAVEIQVALELIKGGWGRGRGYQPPMSSAEEARRQGLRDRLMADRKDEKQVAETESRER